MSFQCFLYCGESLSQMSTCCESVSPSPLSTHFWIRTPFVYSVVTLSFGLMCVQHFCIFAGWKFRLFQHLSLSIYKKCFTCLSLLQDRAILWGMDPESASFLLSVIGKRPCWQRPRGFGAKFKSKKLLSSLPSRAATAWLFYRDCQHSWPAHPRMGQRQGLGQQVSRFF